MKKSTQQSGGSAPLIMSFVRLAYWTGWQPSVLQTKRPAKGGSLSRALGYQSKNETVSESIINIIETE